VAYGAGSNLLLNSSESELDNVEQVSGNATEDVVVKVRMYNTTLAGGGSSEKYALAFSSGDGAAVADAIAYVQAALDAGLDVDEFAGQLSFSSMRTTTSWRRSPNSALPVACGRG
jgi:methylmalonyl-CoA mutase N-terminal domain/subunit